MLPTDLISIIAERPDFYGLDIAAKRKHIGAAVELFEKVTATLDVHARALVDAEMHHVMERLDNTVFLNVNAARRPNHAFLRDFAAVWDRVGHPGSLHLELGTYIAWPDDRTDDYVRAQNIGDIVRLDFENKHRPDVAASATALPFRDESIDRISSNSLFEHVAYPHEILREAFRVLRPGGVIYTAVPFHFVEHACPRDYLRFTGHFFEDVCADIGFETIRTDTRSASGLYYTLHTLAKAALVDSYASGLSMTNAAVGLQMTIMTLLALAQAFDDEIVSGGASHFHTTAFYAVKGGTYQPKLQRFDRSQPFVVRHPDLFLCPRTWSALSFDGQQLLSTDGTSRYPVIDGIPNMVVMQGRGSPAGLSAEVARLERENQELRDRLRDG
jgi:uncharacterized protein YbaR (Trm112 family)